MPEFLDIAGESANGYIWATATGVYNDTIGKALQQRYQKEFDSPAGFSNSGSGYDEVYMLARAWGKVGDPKNFKAVSDEIRTMIHRGVNGGYYMNNKGQVGLAYPTQTPDPSLGQAHLFFQIQDGAHRIIAPEPYIDVDFKPAPWMS